jgi:hypothetical protein
MAKMKFRIKNAHLHEQEASEEERPQVPKVDKNLLEKEVCKRIGSFGAVPIELDSILPPSSDINWETFDFRPYLYRYLIKIKAKSPFGFEAAEETPSPKRETEQR